MSYGRMRVSLPHSTLWLNTVALALRDMACLFLETIMASGLKMLPAMAGLAMAGHAAAQITSYEPEAYQGQARAAYWDVTYNFRGQEHRVQLSRAPGRAITVNEQGEPRA